jgi:hypothetical protein
MVNSFVPHEVGEGAPATKERGRGIESPRDGHSAPVPERVVSYARERLPLPHSQARGGQNCPRSPRASCDIEGVDTLSLTPLSPTKWGKGPPVEANGRLRGRGIKSPRDDPLCTRSGTRRQLREGKAAPTPLASSWGTKLSPIPSSVLRPTGSAPCLPSGRGANPFGSRRYSLPVVPGQRADPAHVCHARAVPARLRGVVILTPRL